MILPEIGATECPFDSGGGGPMLFGQCPNEQLYFFGGASLTAGGSGYSVIKTKFNYEIVQPMCFALNCHRDASC